MDKLNPILTGYRVKLRLANVDDAEFILHLRHMPHVKGKMGDLDISPEQEKAWLRKNVDDPSDYFFIIESPNAVKIGTIGVYNIDYKHCTAEYGRLVVIPGSLAAFPACILLLDFCFNVLQLDTLLAWVVPSNKKIITFNRQLGGEIIKTSYPNSPNQNSESNQEERIYFELTRESWKAHRLPLITLSEQAIKMQVK